MAAILFLNLGKVRFKHSPEGDTRAWYVSQCSECMALVLEMQETEHGAWHARAAESQTRKGEQEYEAWTETLTEKDEPQVPPKGEAAVRGLANGGNVGTYPGPRRYCGTPYYMGQGNPMMRCEFIQGHTGLHGRWERVYQQPAPQPVVRRAQVVPDADHRCAEWWLGSQCVRMQGHGGQHYDWTDRVFPSHA